MNLETIKEEIKEIRWCRQKVILTCFFSKTNFYRDILDSFCNFEYNKYGNKRQALGNGGSNYKLEIKGSVWISFFQLGPGPKPQLWTKAEH